jgi:hypothetical protein
MSDDSTIPASEQDADKAAAEQRAKSLASAIRTLIAELPAAEQEQLFAELRKKLRPISAPQAGDVLGAVVRLFPRQAEWTVEKLKEEVRQQGVPANDKQVYNAIGYLRRKGKIERVGHGRYMVEGALFETAEDLGIGPPTRHEIDDT